MKEGHIIDNILTAMTESRLQHGVEVKGWTEERWRKALEAWQARQDGVKLNEHQEALVTQLQHLLEQLADATTAPRGPPFLVITDKLSRPTRNKLTTFLDENTPNTLLIHIEEAKILELARQLRAALKLPENLSGGAP